MGVRGLTQIVNGQHEHFGQIDLNHCEHLVFDGGNLFRGLLEIDPTNFTYAGDYDRMYYIFRDFFESLQRFRIQAYVVLDGGSNASVKRQSTCKNIVRRLERVRKLFEHPWIEAIEGLPRPILAKRLFIQVLRDMNIPFAVATGEADLLVGSIANLIGCPVVSDDSDFFILDLPHGVLQLTALMEAIKHGTNQCRLYKVKILLQLFQFERRRTLLPIIPVVFGNNFSNEETLGAIRQYLGIYRNNHKAITKLTAYLQLDISLEAVIEDLAFNASQDFAVARKQILREIQEYDLTTVVEESLRLYEILRAPQQYEFAHQPLEQRILNIINCGYCTSTISDVFFYSLAFLPIQVEDIDRRPSFHSAELLSEYIFRLLHAERTNRDRFCIRAFDRREDNYILTIMLFSNTNWRRPDLPVDVLCNNINYNTRHKQQILCNLTDLQIESLTAMEAGTHIFLLALRYWVTHNEAIPQNDIVKSVLVSHTKCHFLMQPLTHNNNQNGRNPEVAHQFCCFQAILYRLLQLNELFMRPFEDLEIRKSVNGENVQAAYSQLTAGNPLETMLTTAEEIEYFVNCLELVIQ